MSASSEQSERVDLQRMLEQSFASGYLTLITIIQGGSLAYLVTILDKKTLTGQDLGKVSCDGWIIAAAALLLIVAVWNEYLMGVTLFRWIPTLWDSFIPFGLGLGQISLITAIERGIGWGSIVLGVFYIGCCWAFLNMYHNAAKRPGNEHSLGSIGKYCWGNPLWCLLWAIVFLPIGLGRVVWSIDLVAPWLVAPLMLSSVITQHIRAWMYWKRPVHDADQQIGTTTRNMVAPLTIASPGRDQRSRVALVVVGLSVIGIIAWFRRDSKNPSSRK